MKKQSDQGQLNPAIMQKILPILNAIGKHPFIKQLSNGTLNPQIYNYYILQDSFYLAAYSKILNKLANKAPTKNEKNFLSQCAIETLQEITATPCKNKSTVEHKLTKACSSYIQFLKVHSQHHYLSGLSAIFPCFFIYKEVAKNFYPENTSNPYLSWFATYTSQLFINQNYTISKMMNESYGKSEMNQKKLMLEIIEQGCLLEWQFWDDAYYQR